MSEKCPRHKMFEATCADILLKLKETNQVYIVGHDIPLSISKHLFNMLDAKRKIEAAKLGVPENQYEFEDIIGLFLGIGITRRLNGRVNQLAYHLGRKDEREQFEKERIFYLQREDVFIEAEQMGISREKVTEEVMARVKKGVESGLGEVWAEIVEYAIKDALNP